MKKFLSLFALCLMLVALPTPVRSQQISPKDKAEIVGVENEFFKDGNYAKIKIRNPYSYNVAVIVELHLIVGRYDRNPAEDYIWMKKYIVLSAREELVLDPHVYVGSSDLLNKDVFIERASPYNYYYTDIKAYKVSVFQQ